MPDVLIADTASFVISVSVNDTFSFSNEDID